MNPATVHYLDPAREGMTLCGLCVVLGLIAHPFRVGLCTIVRGLADDPDYLARECQACITVLKGMTP